LVQEGAKGGGYTRSLSQLKLYTRCGEAYYLERFRRSDIPRRPAAWTILGVAFHDTIMEWEKSGREIDPFEYFKVKYDAVVADEWERQEDADYWILPPNTKTVPSSIINYRKRGLEQLSTYITRCNEAAWEISCLEREFEIPIGPVVVRGAVDRILLYPTEETYVIEDLKTGSPEGEDDVRQLGFYAYVARTLWDIPVREGRYWFTKLDRGSDPVDLSGFDQRYWETAFERLDKGINQGLFLASPGRQCGMCGVKPWCSTMGWLKIGEPLK